MTEKNNRIPVETEAYLANRQRRNWIVLCVLLAFVAFTTAMTMLKFDVRDFMSVTYQHEGRRQQLDAQHNLKQNLEKAQETSAGETHQQNDNSNQ